MSILRKAACLIAVCALACIPLASAKADIQQAHLTYEMGHVAYRASDEKETSVSVVLQDGDTTLPATVSRVSALGSVVRLELIQSPGGEIAEVEMTREHYAVDPLRAGDMVFVKPRQMRVFLHDDPKIEPLVHWNGDGDGI